MVASTGDGSFQLTAQARRPGRQARAGAAPAFRRPL
jgi:hypothetical protein